MFFHDTIQCVGGFVLTGQGEIVGQALEGGDIQPDLIAVTGGTGQFRNARGQASVTFLPNGQVRFVFELLP